jgi:hypothetical protein
MVRLLALLLGISICAVAQGPWKPLFNGKSLEGWLVAAFPRHPDVRVENAAIIIPAGAPLSGVVYPQFSLRNNYEIRWEAMREAGGDFFSSLTLPAENGYFTFVTGGWGGDIVGISSIDGWDASDNETRSYYTFENGQWYRFRVQVTTEKIQAWINEKQVVDLAINGRTLSLRPGDTKLTTPLGFMTYNTTGWIRKVEVRSIR